MLKFMVALAAAIAGPVYAEDSAAPDGDTGSSKNKTVLLFTEAPCTAVLEGIEMEMPEYPSKTEIFFYGTDEHFQRMGRTAAIVGTTWGFLLGYDAAIGGLSTNEQTTLERLKAECAKTPDIPAIKVLGRMSARLTEKNHLD